MWPSHCFLLCVVLLGTRQQLRTVAGHGAELRHPAEYSIDDQYALLLSHVWRI
jgi:hypothetical protein